MNKEKNQKPGAKNKVSFDPESGKIKADIPLSAYTKNDDALNPSLNKIGQGTGTHEVDINRQTDLELGALADPGGIEPASDQEFLEEMGDKIEKKQNGR